MLEGRPIEAFTVPAGVARAPRVLLIAPPAVLRQEMRKFEDIADSRRRFDLYALSLPVEAVLVFPPRETGDASAAIWRWIGTLAPDLVLKGEDTGGLEKALSENSVAGLGRIPVRAGRLSQLKTAPPVSEAHAEADRRLARDPKQVAELLATVYARDLPSLDRSRALGQIARIRLGQLAEVELLAAPYREGQSALNAAGFPLFAELARVTGDPRYAALARTGSDARPVDGIYPVSAIASAVLGLEFRLGVVSKDQENYEEMVRDFQNNMALCARLQGADGMWRAPADRSGAWPDLEGTAMIGAAMMRGVRNGRLDGRAYTPHIERAWSAVSLRTAGDGTLLSRCECRDESAGAAVFFFATEMAGLR